MRERADPVRRPFGGQRAGGVAAAAQDHQGDQLRLADQRVGGGLTGHPDQLDRPPGPGRRLASDGAITSSARAAAERSAALPVRSTPALRDLTSCEAMSTTTFGLASKFAPITPDRAAALGEHEAAGQVA